MTSKPIQPPREAGTPPIGAGRNDSALESIGKAITDAVWESSGEADKSAKGQERREAAERTQQPKD